MVALTACGGKEQPTINDSEIVKEGDLTEEQSMEPKQEKEVSIDFENGNKGFVTVYTQVTNADPSLLEIVDYHGSKALKVTNAEGKIPYVAFDIGSMLGERISEIKTIEMTIGTEYATGKFSALSGKIISWAGVDATEYQDAWAVYIESKNPNKAVAKIDAGEEFVADADNIIMITIDTDNGLTEGNGNANLYIDDIRFLDALGNVMQVDTTIAFVKPKAFEGSDKDLSNLTELSEVIEFTGFEKKADAWAQDGLEMPQEIIDALVPGAIIEIEYMSESGDMWIVLPDAQVGWSRIGDGINEKAYINQSKNIAQITYEQIVAVCGEDKSTWGARLQTESSGDWEVYRVIVGHK